MERDAGYLAQVLNIPPLIFRFQFNPESITEKKSFAYEAASEFGQWGFDQTSAGGGGIGAVAGFLKDVKEFGPLLTNVKPLVAKEGQPRQLSVEFQLDASVPGPLDGDDHYGGSIEPDLAVLRSFMNPAWDVIDVTKAIIEKKVPCWKNPPVCYFKYGGLSMDCVMTDLNIKVTAFQADRTPLRAEVSVSLQEQTFSFSPLGDIIVRHIDVARSYGRKGIGKDFLATAPVTSIFF